LSTTEVSKVMKELHEGVVKGHFAIEITNKKMLDARYWWPTMYKDVSALEGWLCKIWPS